MGGPCELVTRAEPYTDADWLHGYFVTDGKRYRHVTELQVSHSADGTDWQPAGTVVVPGSAERALGLSDR